MATSKVIKEIVTDVGGNTTIEYSDDTTQKYNVADVVTAQVNPLTGGIELLAGGVNGPIVYQKGVVASRCSIPTGASAANTQLMTRSKHVAMDYVKALQIAYANYFVDVGVESNAGAAGVYTASIEYPVGTITPVTFSGADQGSVADGETLVSDSVSVTIPKGAVFYVRTWQSNAAGVVWVARRGLANATGVVPTSGEWSTVGVTTPDLTKSATNSNNGMTSNSFVPLAIIGLTSRPSFLIVGDSRCSPSGSLETIPNAFGGVGEVERSICKSYGSINASDPGETLLNVSGTGFTKRQALAQWVSHVIISLGINDFTASRTNTVCIGYLTTIGNKFPGKAVYACTVSPKSASTDSWATTVNQTTNATANPARVLYNDNLRANPPPPIGGVFDIADQVESARNSGLWKVTGLAFGYTSDGLHENSAGFSLTETSQIFSAVDF